MNFRYDQSRQHRTILLILIPIIGLPFLLVFLLRPPLQRQEPRPPKNDNETALQGNSKSLESTPTAGQPATADGERDQKTVHVDQQSRHVEPSPSPAGFSDVRSSIERKVTETQEKREAAIVSYERTLQTSDSELLSKFGGTEWTEIQTLKQDAIKASQPETAIRKLEEAEHRLSELLPKLSLRLQMADIQTLQQDGHDLAFLRALCDESLQSPDSSAEFTILWQDVDSWDENQWLKLARSEADAMTPDDAGFAEVWHAFADYYQDVGQ